MTLFHYYRLALGLLVVFSVESIFSQSTFPLTTTGSIESPTSTASLEAQTHTVTVGKERNQFSPDSIEAAIHGVIEFEFFPPDHSVVRAEYMAPCVPIESTSPSKVGFFSGVHVVKVELENPPTWSLTINDTEPIFFYCAAYESCNKSSMVGVINPDNSVSLDMQKEMARNATTIIPGQSVSRDESGSSSTTEAASDAHTASHPHLSSGAIAGIAVAAVVVAAGIGFLLVLLGRHRTEIRFLRRDVNVQRQSHRPVPTAPMHEYSSAGQQPNPGPSVPYDSEDVKIHDPQDAVPPYTQSTEPPQSFVAELPSPPIGTSTGGHGSSFGELGTHNDTVTAAQRNMYLGYGSGPGYGGGGGEGGGGNSSDSS